MSKTKAAIVAVAAAIATFMSLTPAALAVSGAATCSGKSSGGMCFYSNANFVPPAGWFNQNSNIPHFSSYYFNGTTSTMHDTVSSAHNFSTSCTAYVYKNANYAIPDVAFPPRTQLQTFSGSAIGNDSADSLYWNC